MTTRIARSTLSEVVFSEDAINEVNEMMLAARRMFFSDGDVLAVEIGHIELIDKIHNVAAGIIRYNRDSGLTFTPAAERVQV